ncbi:aromatic alcohol reductase [Sphingomonas sp. 22176]|uniref:aromatic alcohol reductase n=1 Tax=Sphingomonas sp. 22176 TaxID=3453884 RepID=UPI003F873665
MAQRTGNSQGMDDTERPSVAGMGQHLPLQPVIIVAERIAGRLRVRNHGIEVQVVKRYHACAFFLLPTVLPFLHQDHKELLMPETKITTPTTLVVGAGELGLAVINGLLERHPENVGSISVLLRPSVDAVQEQLARQLQDKALHIVRADLATETVEGLAAIFAPFTTIICCTGFVGGPGTQRKITKAVIQAGVERYVPWQFGVDYDVVGHGSGQPVFDEQSDVRDLLRGQSATEWVIVSTGMFTSFLFKPAFGLVDLERPRVHALGSWDNRLTVTTSNDIGRLTAAILAHEPRIRDEVVYVAGDTFSYAQLADMVEGHLGRDAERVLLDMDQLRSEVASHPDDGMRKYRLAFARDTGVAWDKDRSFNVAQGIDLTDVSRWLKQRKGA